MTTHAHGPTGKPDKRKRGNKWKVTGPWKAYRVAEAYYLCEVAEGAGEAACWHKTEGAAARHCEKLNRKHAREVRETQELNR